MHLFVHQLAANRPRPHEQLRSQHCRTADHRIKHALPEIGWIALQQGAVSTLQKAASQRNGGIRCDDLAIKHQLVLPLFAAPVMSNGIAEGLRIAVDVIVVFAQPIAKIVAGLNFDCQLEAQIVIGLMKGRGSGRTQVDVLISPAEVPLP